MSAGRQISASLPFCVLIDSTAVVVVDTGCAEPHIDTYTQGTVTGVHGGVAFASASEGAPVRFEA